MSDARIDALAKVIVDFSIGLKAGDLFRLRSETVAEPLVLAIYKLAVERGAMPLLRLALPGQSHTFFRYAAEGLLDQISPATVWESENITADLVIFSDTNTKEMSGIDPSRQARVQKAARPMMQRWMERAFTSPPEIRWCGTLYPTLAYAQDAGMSLEDYKTMVFKAMFLDLPDPVAAWNELSKEQARYCDYLNQRSEIHIEAEDTDLTMSVEGRTWINADGHLNFPDGEVFTGPVENSVNGTIRYPYPTNYHGRQAEDVRLWFENGYVTRWEAKQGKDLLDELFAMDEGARRLGEVAIGNNYQVPEFTGNILFDEKIGGTCHLAVGNSIPGTGGVNVSALHWDMVCDLRRGGRVSADGEIIHENGVWKI